MIIPLITLILVTALVYKLVPKILSRLRIEHPKVDPEFIDINTTEPFPYRPFKPRYHLTMGLMKASYQDWIGLDNRYHWFADYRKKLHQDHWEATNLVVREPATGNAILELYTRVLTYLCTKYPQYFEMEDGIVHNKLRDTKIPMSNLSKIDCKHLLATLAENTQEDYLLLEFDAAQQEYVCKAMTASFPSGFNSLEKLNKKLTDIHVPQVPGYEQKLKRSMNKYFAKLEYPQIVQRLNWSIQPKGTQLYSPSTNHAAPNEKLRAYAVEDLDFENEVFMRVERQLLSRLPDSRFLLFTVRTHLTQIKQLKSEGHAQALCAAIDGIPADMAQYKCVPQWRDAIKEYMVGGK